KAKSSTPSPGKVAGNEIWLDGLCKIEWSAVLGDDPISLKELEELARLKERKTPTTFDGQLRPYQERGLGWLAFLGQLGLGACLADDMGLGKTAQLLALLLEERVRSEGPTL